MPLPPRLLRFVLAAIPLLVTGCAVESEPIADATDEIKGGAFTFERPEIGSILQPGGGICTGTLVAPNVVLTAAHCVDYREASHPDEA